MTDDNNTAIDASQIDDDILSYTVSDEALEAAAGTERGPAVTRRGIDCCPAAASASDGSLPMSNAISLSGRVFTPHWSGGG
jgi:hypothetical protein